jgi:hypothetical protein
MSGSSERVSCYFRISIDNVAGLTSFPVLGIKITQRREAVVSYVKVLVRLGDGNHDSTVVQQIDGLGVSFNRH